tara:strand:+ start:2838 stop:3407 length:570 start_codon:yes stop_codon:yes gene_type:complete
MYYQYLGTFLKIMSVLKQFISIPLFISLIILNSCGIYKKVDQRQMPDGASAKARKNVEEGRSINIGGLMKNRGSTNYEFSTSNPMWRASLEILDFLPLSTVDYSGGVIITDWYSENNSDESIKISIRFLSNEVRSDNLKIIVHKRKCASANNCTVLQLGNNEISNELLTSIVKTAAKLEQEDKKKNKKK